MMFLEITAVVARMFCCSLPDALPAVGVDGFSVIKGCTNRGMQKGSVDEDVLLTLHVVAALSQWQLEVIGQVQSGVHWTMRIKNWLLASSFQLHSIPSQTCSHSKATEFYAESVRECDLPTRSCKSYADFVAGKCAPSCEDGRTCGLMGHPARVPLAGHHFTKTTKQQCPSRTIGYDLRVQTTPRRMDPDAMLVNSL
ncbi:uncharacterized protein [Dermacentor albipictus]|uniref:uncharacterized protein n=1 Tax=Dermacentor albipictus TaxID=60249 RepID=UPI0038FD2E6E